MPSLLYNRIIEILGKENVLQVSLDKEELSLFNRHIIHKIDDWSIADPIIENALATQKKVLVVCNRVKTAQEQYAKYKQQYPDLPILLLHSRFKKTDRNEKERLLLGLDEMGKAIGHFNTSDSACLVVSTQVVEVSLDISFDCMITEAAPIDSLAQRFGRVNRKRSSETIGKYKPIYVLAPHEDEKEALPYLLDIVNRSYQALPDGELLKENELQEKIDQVFTEIDFLKIEQHSVFKESGKWSIDKLTHNPKAILLDLLEIDSVSCICEADEEAYLQSTYEERVKMEISTRYYVVRDLRQLDWGSKPFIVPDSSYDSETGFDVSLAKASNYSSAYSFL